MTAVGTKARPAQLRPHAAVQQWRAEVARKTAQAGTGPGRDSRFRWPEDRNAVVAEILAAAVRVPLPAGTAREGGRR